MGKLCSFPETGWVASTVSVVRSGTGGHSVWVQPVLPFEGWWSVVILGSRDPEVRCCSTDWLMKVCFPLDIFIHIICFSFEYN